METKIQNVLGRAEKIFGVKPVHLNRQKLEDIDHAELLDLVRGKIVKSTQHTLIPIMIQNQLDGAIQLPADQNEKNLVVGNLIRSVLETASQQLDRLEQIRFEESLHEKLVPTVSNVVYLKDRRVPAKNLDTHNLPQAKKSVMNFPFVIEALEAHDAFCMAVNIHELSGRYAFLTIDNLDKTAFNTIESFEALGPMTIYIDDIEALDLELQTNLARCLTDRKSDRIPQVILGTDESLTILKMSPMVDQNLLRKITVGYLHMDQPFSFYKNGDLLRFFADSLMAKLALDL